MSTAKASAAPSSSAAWLPRTAVIDAITAETPGVATYRLKTFAPGPTEYAFASGQFNMLYLPGFGETAISMSGSPLTTGDDPAQRGWVHTIREAGLVTTALAKFKPGDRLALRGPYGKPWPVADCRGRDLVLIAGGIGLAPLRPVIYEVLAHRAEYGRLILLMGAKTPEGLLYRGEYDVWESQGLEIHLTVDRAEGGWTGNVGVVPWLLDRLQLAAPDRTSIFTCGPEIMMRYSAVGAMAQGVAAENIWVSLERHMQCAIGLCGHCQLGTELLCRDGPVYPYSRVQPLLSVHDL